MTCFPVDEEAGVTWTSREFSVMAPIIALLQPCLRVRQPMRNDLRIRVNKGLRVDGVELQEGVTKSDKVRWDVGDILISDVGARACHEPVSSEIS